VHGGRFGSHSSALQCSEFSVCTVLGALVIVILRLDLCHFDIVVFYVYQFKTKR